MGFNHNAKRLERAAVYALTAHSLRLVERAAMCVKCKEPLLLVGETGTGKTALVQYLARLVSVIETLRCDVCTRERTSQSMCLKAPSSKVIVV